MLPATLKAFNTHICEWRVLHHYTSCGIDDLCQTSGTLTVCNTPPFVTLHPCLLDRSTHPKALPTAQSCTSKLSPSALCSRGGAVVCWWGKQCHGGSESHLNTSGSSWSGTCESGASAQPSQGFRLRT